MTQFVGDYGVLESPESSLCGGAVVMAAPLVYE